MSDRAKALVGQTIQLAGRDAIVRKWSKIHPASQPLPEDQAERVIEFKPIETEHDPDGWLKISIQTANPGQGQWWSYSVLTGLLNK